MGPNMLIDFLRTIFAYFNALIFQALRLCYSVFFDVASYNIFSTQTVYKVFSRVQLIIGVFMLFQFALTILRGIIEPDGVIGGKDGGNARKIIVRIITCVALLALLYPVRINKSSMNEYEKQINNNGLLFGTLNSLQYRILGTNTIGKLILGPTRAGDVDFVGDENEDGYVKSWEAGGVFTTSMFKAFYPINIDDNGNYKCNKKEWIDIYNSDESTISDIAGLADKSCSGEYFIDNNAITAFACAIFFMFVFISMSMDVAIRMFKLAILRIISPIPVISYMDPNGKKDGAFSSWTKILTSTYLDLFIRLATVYLILFIIAELSNSDSIAGINFINANSATGNRGFWSTVIIVIGLFAFAKQAPKFVRQALGLKEEGNGLFSGLATILGTVGSAATAWRAKGEENEAFDNEKGITASSASFGHNMMNKGKQALAAISGVGSGAMAAGAVLGENKASYHSVLDGISQANKKRASHSTLPGRLWDSTYQTFTGQSLATAGNNRVKAAQDFIKAQSSWKSALEEAAIENGKATDLGLGKDSKGNVITARYEELERAVASAHDGIVTLNGNTFDSNIFTKSFMDKAKKAQVIDWQVRGNYNGDSYAELIKAGNKLFGVHEDVERAYHDVDVSKLESDVVKNNWKSYNADDIGTFGVAVGAANNVISDETNSMRNIMRNANNQNKSN